MECLTHVFVSVLLPQANEKPVYLNALMPSDSDKLGPQPKLLNSENLSTTSFDQHAKETKDINDGNEKKATVDLMYQNPFLKPPRKLAINHSL